MLTTEVRLSNLFACLLAHWAAIPTKPTLSDICQTMPNSSQRIDIHPFDKANETARTVLCQTFKRQDGRLTPLGLQETDPMKEM